MTRWVYLLALAAGIAFAVSLLSLHAIWPSDPLHVALVGDPAVSALGQRYFIAEPWGWPLLHASRLEAPGGVNIAMTDSIPLAALVLKLLRSTLPPGLFASASWVALVWSLQPVAAVYALRSAGERRFVPTAAIVVLSLSMPTFLIRYGHMALCTHAAILAALGLYLRLVAAPARPTSWLFAGTLAVLCLLVHPYILAMVMGVLGAVPITLALRRSPQWRLAASAYATIIVIVGLAAILFDYGGTTPAPGFGTFSMNLLGPFLPSRSGLFPDLAPDATGWQSFEGFQYLGAGLLLLLAVAIVQGIRGRSRLAWQRHAGLLLVLAAMTVFALSDKMYVGHHRFLHIRFVPAVAEQFRATGRFFWPVAYVVLLAGVLVAARSLSRTAAAALLALAVMLQVADTAPLRNGLWTAGHAGTAWQIDTAKLGPIFAAHDHLTLWPTFGCGGFVEDNPTMQVLLLASQTTMVTNTMFSARTHEAAVCDASTVLEKPLEPGELRVVTHMAERMLVPDFERDCRVSGTLMLCARDASGWTDLPPAVPVSVPVGTEMSPVDPRLIAVLEGDWSIPVPQGIWSSGNLPALDFALPPGVGAGAVLTLRAQGFAATAGGTQPINVLANGVPIAHWLLHDMAPTTVQATLPASISSPVLVQMRVASPARPVDRGMNADVRRLGILLLGLRLDPAGR
jgi:hypothetical protein